MQLAITSQPEYFLFDRALLESCQDVCIVSQVGQEHMYESKKIVRHIEFDHITS